MKQIIKRNKVKEKIRFGPSGIQANIFKEKKMKTLDIPKWIKNENLDAYEVCFGTSFNMKLETAKKIGIEAKKENILISLHAPYYINLGSPNEEAEKKDFERLEKSLEYLKLMKGKKLVFHIGSEGKETRDIVLERIKKRIIKFLKKIENDISLRNIFLCPETMGKYSQIGNPDEIIDICSLNKKLIPTFDFGHINCLLQGNLNEEEIKRIFLLSFEKLGDFRTKNCHIHFSKIEYGAKGEKKHLNYSDTDFGPDFKILGKIIKELQLTPTIITESATDMLDDAKTLKNIFNEKI